MGATWGFTSREVRQVTAEWLYATQLAHARQTVQQHQEAERLLKRQIPRRLAGTHTTTYGPTVDMNVMKLVREEYERTP